MAFEDKEGLYRRFTRVWHILIILGLLLFAPYLFNSSSDAISNTKGIQIIFGECFMCGLVFLASFAMNFGMAIWVTFVAGLVMYKNLPVHTFGAIQSKLFPYFFLIGSITGLAMLFVTFLQARTLGALSMDQKLLVIAVGCVAFPYILNGLWFGPVSTEAVLEKHRMEKEEPDETKRNNDPKYKDVRKRFGQIHGIMTIFNLFAMLANTYILYWLSQQLHSLSAAKSG